MSELSVLSLMNTIIPITRFNKGEANRIFEEVEAGGPKVVMKNNRPACVLISPRKYESLMEMLSDYILMDEASSRISHFDGSGLMSRKDVMEELGISEADLDDVQVDIE